MKDKELEEIRLKIKDYVNKYDVKEFKVEIFKLWQEKTVSIKVDK